MTTAEKFFEKLFLEGSKAENSYKNYNFRKLSDEERSFLNELTIISRYKKFFINFFTNKKSVKTNSKKDYIDIYKQNLTYKELISYNILIEDKTNSQYNSLYLFAGLLISSYLFFVIRSTNISLKREMPYVFLFSGLGTYGYYKYKNLNFKNEIDSIYDTLSNRLNRFPELKASKNDIYSTELIMEDDDMDEIY